MATLSVVILSHINHTTHTTAVNGNVNSGYIITYTSETHTTAVNGNVISGYIITHY